MSFPYEGPQNALRSRIRPSAHQIEKMEGLPMKPDRKSASEQAAKPAILKPRATVAKRKSPIKHTAKPLPSEQPRDRLGRFARKTGQVLLGAAKGTVKAVKSTAKAVKRAHKSIKRVQSNARRRTALEHRERRLDLHKREQAAGLKRKKVVRRRKR